MTFFWLLIVLLLIWALMIPAWPYHRRYGYGSSPIGAISGILLVFLLLRWSGPFTVAI